jgi:hypothetical protein
MNTNPGSMLRQSSVFLFCAIFFCGCTTAKIKKWESAWGPEGGIYKEELIYEHVGDKKIIKEQIFYGPNGKKTYSLSFNEYVITSKHYAEDGNTVLSNNDYTTFNLVRQVETLRAPLYLFPTISKTTRGLTRVDYHNSMGNGGESGPEATVYFTEDGQRTDPFKQISSGLDEESVLALVGPPTIVWQDKYFRRTEYRTPTHRISLQWRLEDPKKLADILRFVEMNGY